MAASLSEDTSLLSLAIASHGGLPTWQKFRTSTFKFNFSGAFLTRKGYPGHYQPHVRVSTSTARTEITGIDLERPSDTWIFTAELVWTQDADGALRQSRPEPPYFIGYALWNYTTFPFALEGPGFKTREIEEHWEPGYVNSDGVLESWRVLEVSFPEHYDAHTRLQKFYFDREKLWIRRMDYVTDVAKGVAAHYCFDHQVIKGIVVPMLRRVVGRFPGTSTARVFGPSGFTLDYFDVDFEE